MNFFNHVFCFSYYIIIVWLNSLVDGTLSFGPFWLSPMTLSMMGVACFVTCGQSVYRLDKVRTGQFS